MNLEKLVGQRVSAIGTCGVAKDKKITGRLRMDSFPYGYVIDDENNRDIPCSFDKNTIEVLGEIECLKK